MRKLPLFLVCEATLFLPQNLSQCLIVILVSSPLSVNKIDILLQRTIMINLKLNPDKPVSGERVSICIKLTRKCIPYQTYQWYFLVNQWGYDSRNWNWNDPKRPSHTVSSSAFAPRWRIKKPKAKSALTPNTKERKMVAATVLSLSPNSKSCCRPELG